MSPFFDASVNQNIGATIRIDRQIQFLRYAWFFFKCSRFGAFCKPRTPELITEQNLFIFEISVWYYCLVSSVHNQDVSQNMFFLWIKRVNLSKIWRPDHKK